jgi:hypothetical protein
MDSEAFHQGKSPRSRWLRGCATFVVLSLLILSVACVLGYTSIRQGVVSPPDWSLGIGSIALNARITDCGLEVICRRMWFSEPGDPKRDWPLTEPTSSEYAIWLEVGEPGLSQIKYALVRIPLTP